MTSRTAVLICSTVTTAPSASEIRRTQSAAIPPSAGSIAQSYIFLALDAAARSVGIPPLVRSTPMKTPPRNTRLLHFVAADSAPGEYCRRSIDQKDQFSGGMLHPANPTQSCRHTASLSYEEPEGSEPERHQGCRAGGGGGRTGGSGDRAGRRQRSDAYPTRFAPTRRSNTRPCAESGDGHRAPQHCARPRRAVSRPRRSDDPDDGRIVAPTGSTRRDGKRRLQGGVLGSRRLHPGPTRHPHDGIPDKKAVLEKPVHAARLLTADANPRRGAARIRCTVVGRGHQSRPAARRRGALAARCRGVV